MRQVWGKITQPRACFFDHLRGGEGRTRAEGGRGKEYLWKERGSRSEGRKERNFLGGERRRRHCQIDTMASLWEIASSPPLSLLSVLSQARRSAKRRLQKFWTFISPFCIWASRELTQPSTIHLPLVPFVLCPPRSKKWREGKRTNRWTHCSKSSFAPSFAGVVRQKFSNFEAPILFDSRSAATM